MPPYYFILPFFLYLVCKLLLAYIFKPSAIFPKRNFRRSISSAYFESYLVERYTIFSVSYWPNRSVSVWAPEDAIDKAFAASPTLTSHPELLEKIKTSPGLSAGRNLFFFGQFVKRIDIFHVLNNSENDTRNY